MTCLNTLKKSTDLYDLAKLLNVDSNSLARLLFEMKSTHQYTEFKIKKRSGSEREIAAPNKELKAVQTKLSNLLQNCDEEISKQANIVKKQRLSHGFIRDRSIFTNASQHTKSQNVANIDLEDFFGSINFGRVRGYFIKNKNFLLEPKVATIIARIACHNNKLPQGSPCSPVISNLIAHPMDIHLATVAKKYSCTYSRYADDITFSTNKKTFPKELISIGRDNYLIGKPLAKIITTAGFKINHKKTRIQFKNSRQDATGIVINEKVSIKKEYWKSARAKCNSLFHKGYFIDNAPDGSKAYGNIKKLEGQLNFIDQADFYNRKNHSPQLDPHYALYQEKIETKRHLNTREKLFSQFLHFTYFHYSDNPTILCEGKTDNVYLKCALKSLYKNHPSLVNPNNNSELYLKFLKYSARTKFLLQLSGGTSYLASFIESYGKAYNFYGKTPPENPVIIILDNDDGFKKIKGKLSAKHINATPYPVCKSNDKFINSNFIHVTKNLYLVLTPRADDGTDTSIEDLFDETTKNIKISGKSFNKGNASSSNNNTYSKEIFANKIIKARQASIDFSGFTVLFNRIEEVLHHYSEVYKEATTDS